MVTIVDMLGDMGFLKENSLEQTRTAARKIGTTLESITSALDVREPSLGLDLNLYLNKLGGLASEAEVTALDENNPECPGAVKKSTWLLREEDLNLLTEAALTRISSVPVLGNELHSGRLHIGSQVITDDFLRKLFASLHGETVLTFYQDAAEKAILVRLDIPDISSLVRDETFAQTRGIEFTVERSGSRETGDEASLTTLRLIGLEGTLLSMRREMLPGKEIDPLPTKNIVQVGEMNSADLQELVHSMRLTIAANALNLVMDLPRAVFDLLVDRLF